MLQPFHISYINLENGSDEWLHGGDSWDLMDVVVEDSDGAVSENRTYETLL